MLWFKANNADSSENIKHWKPFHPPFNFIYKGREINFTTSKVCNAVLLPSSISLSVPGF